MKKLCNFEFIKVMRKVFTSIVVVSLRKPISQKLNKFVEN